MFDWVGRDGKLIISARGVRTFAQGFVAVLLALYLDKLGFSIVQIGAVLSVGVAGSASSAFLVGLASEKLGRRRLLIVFALISAATGVFLFFVNSFIALLFISFFGNLATGSEGPIQPLEQAILPDTAPNEKRTDLFAIYGIVARSGTALGALAAGIPAILQRASGMDELYSFKVMFLAFSAFQLMGIMLYGSLSPSAEGTVVTKKWMNPLQLPSRRLIFTLTGLFSVDHFAGSLVTQSLVAYFFATRFGIELSSLAFIFFFSNVLTAVSLWLAAKIANRIGLLNTMVFTHIPSSVFLIAITFTPVGWLAVLFWQLRSFLAQIDVPTRESYTMAVVGQEERVAMGSISIVGRSAMGSAGPLGGDGFVERPVVERPFHSGRGLEDCLRYFSLLHVSQRKASRRRKEGPKTRCLCETLI